MRLLALCSLWSNSRIFGCKSLIMNIIRNPKSSIRQENVAEFLTISVHVCGALLPRAAKVDQVQNDRTSECDAAVTMGQVKEVLPVSAEKRRHRNHACQNHHQSA